MSITAGSTIVASDFVSTSSGGSDSGKVAMLNSSGQLVRGFIADHIKFGGSGSDGALSISSGTTDIDCGAAQLVVKNYTSISITSTGKLTFSNPHANGTVVILKSQGNVTLTATAPIIDMAGMGAFGGVAVSRISIGDTNGNGGSQGTNTFNM